MDRDKLVQLVVFFLFFLVVSRLFQIQVINASKYKAQAREQHWFSNKIPAKRGTIYTSDRYPVVFSITSYYPRFLMSGYKDLSEFKKYLSKHYTDSQMEIINATNLEGEVVKIPIPVNWEIKEAMLSENPEIRFEEAYSRFYPEHTMLSNALGFIGRDKAGNEVGYYGLEQYYDGYLKGHDGWTLTEKSAIGDPILWGGAEKLPEVDGSDLVLTIDRNIQFIVENHLKDGVDRYNALSGNVVVMDPKTGEVLAMAKYPPFDPSADKRNLNLDDVRNDIISSVYEPGSVIKAITMAAAIDLGAVDLGTTYNDTGPREFSGYKVNNWDGKNHGVIDMTQVLQLSNNLAIAWVGQKVGSETLFKYFNNFSLGRYTNIDLEGEELGLMHKKFPLKDIELANASFGQGISVTPIQVLSSFALIANEGKLMRPHLVSEIISPDKVIKVEPEILDRPISENTAKTMVEMLTQTVSGGEAKYFVSKKYLIAGKTGTAQIPVRGGYAPHRTNATFVGFFPTYKNFVMIVRLEEPSNPSGYAAETAVPLWMRIAEDIADYYGLLPDRPQSN